MPPDSRFRLEDMRGFAAEAIAMPGERSAAQISASLPWKEAVGLRNILIHGYGQIRIDVVVATVRDHFPALVSALDRILRGEAP